MLANMYRHNYTQKKALKNYTAPEIGHKETWFHKHGTSELTKLLV